MLLARLEQIVNRSRWQPILQDVERRGWSMPPVDPPPPLDPDTPRLPADWITSLVLGQDGIPIRSRHGEDDMIHVSALVDFCPRQYALARQFDVTLMRPVRAQDRVIWTMGLAAEAHVVGQFSEAHGAPHVRTGVNLYLSRLRLMGRPDLMAQTALTTWAVVECKSMNRPDFEALDAPLADHVIQAALYRWMAIEEGWPVGGAQVNVHTHVILIYVCKDYVHRGVPYKEFHIDCTRDNIVRQVDLSIGLAEEFQNAQEQQRIPQRTQCADQDCSRARGCPVSHLCFSISEGGT